MEGDGDFCGGGDQWAKIWRERLVAGTYADAALVFVAGKDAYYVVPPAARGERSTRATNYDIYTTNMDHEHEHEQQ